MLNTVNETAAFDIVIVGGGLTGASLALAFQALPLRVAMIEAVSPPEQTADNYDARSVALSESSQRIFSEWGLWDALLPWATPILDIHVSDQGHFGFTRLSAKAQGVAALGYVFEMQALMTTLLEAVLSLPRLTRFAPARLVGLARGDTHWQLTVTQAGQTRQLTAPLVIAADGSHSWVRTQQAIPVTVSDSTHSAVVANVSVAQGHQQVAYERFTQLGPLALLPMSQSRCALVWTVDQPTQTQLMQCSPRDFLAQLQYWFGYRLGRFTKIGQRMAYPLQTVVAQQQVQSGLVLVGHAAHTLYPVAAQGFNLSLRDARVLAQVLTQAIAAGESWWQLAVLTRYAQQRAFDQRAVMGLTQLLTQVFGRQWPLLTPLRDIAMVCLDVLPPLKTQFVKIAGMQSLKISNARQMCKGVYGVKS